MRICMVAYSFYESDNRIMRYAEALAGRGDNVDVLALRNNNNATYENINGVNVYRIQSREINERTKLSYLTRMMRFFIRSGCMLTTKHLKKPYDLIHVHSIPDFEVFATLIPKLLGAKVILDVHDIVPEFYASKFGVNKGSAVFKALKIIERLSTNFANHVIIANHLWEKVITERSVKQSKCSTFLNYPDSSMFNTTLRTRHENGRFIMMYPGTLNWHQGLDIAIKAMDLIRDKAPEAELHIYGYGSAKNDLSRLIEERSLQKQVKVFDGLPIKKIAGLMANADLGIVPKRNDSFGGDAFSTKIFEFMALGVPIVASGTRIDRYYFNDSIIKFFEPGDEQSLAEAMLTMIKNQRLRKELAANALSYIAGQSWDIKRQDYYDLVERLVKGKS